MTVIGPLVGSVDLDAAAAAGWLTPPTPTGLGPVRRHRPTTTVRSALDEVRGG